MAKTAEEILKENVNIDSVESLYLWRGNITDAMREFAAQEVEEYKAKLKTAIMEYNSAHILNKNQINIVIDTVK